MSEISTENTPPVDMMAVDADEDTPSSSDKENLISKQSEKLDKKLAKEKQLELERQSKENERLSKKRQLELEKQEKRKKVEEERELKRKKVEQERELKRKKIEEEKETKRKKLEEEKLIREQKKLEEKLAKEKEKQERLEKKEQERKAKEIERKKIEDEKKRAEELKERSQMKISSFFQIKSIKNEDVQTTPSEVISSTPLQDTGTSKYDTDFLSFFIQKNVTMMTRPISLTKQELDEIITNPTPEPEQFTTYLNQFTPNPSPSKQTTPDEIISALNSSTTTETQVYQLISQLPPIKYISFYENEKPPYIGTWCSTSHKTHQVSIIGNPINSDITGFDYDYDSDLEWNKDDEEGEDLDVDDGDEDEDESMLLPDEDDDEFVENDGVRKKRFISLQVINKWNNEENKEFFDDFKVVIMRLEQESIDPFYNYWTEEQQGENSGSDIDLTNLQITTPVKVGSPNILTPQKKLIKDPIILSQLIQFIEKNNDFTIGTLVELSKKEFKQFTKGIIKNTIQDIACYNKKTSIWEIKAEIKSSLELGV